MNVTIAKPQTKHAKAIAAICSSGWKQTVEGKLSEEYQIQNIVYWYNHERVVHDIHNGAYTFTALIDSKVAGVIGGGMIGPNAGEIFVLYVDETYRYKGIGRHLLEVLTQKQMISGAAEQWVSVQKGNQLGIPFYEARGFKCHGRRVTTTETGEKKVALRYSRQVR
ncbi:GNAT family N-acetyltransferase [Lentibacillus halodurans]|uniref:GNAT family N-acetyltransferase n=1 Tax=Lentibacillus halodurans TaxID=237679 RepID=UPI000B7EC5EF|nr:GNAT family N-acetyltransferase [Lentibacillus halodurans]